MNILINTSNLKAGGGLQVADSICHHLHKFSKHNFVIIFSTSLSYLKDEALRKPNIIKTYIYEIKNNFRTLFLGRDLFLDTIVEKHKIDGVLTIFGPSRWEPRCPHLCGFATGQLIFKDSPFYQIIKRKTAIRWFFKLNLRKYLYQRSTKYLYSENPYVTKQLTTIFKDKETFTITNYYNQVFDEPARWESVDLLPFNGVRILSIATPYPHKNLKIAIPIASYLKKHYPQFNFRFVFSFDNYDYPKIPNDLKNNFEFVGIITINKCPYLYQHSDICFQPSLMECFTATYPEAMKMKIPIVTTDLAFAHSLCGDAACYYESLNAEAAAEAIYKVATNKDYAYQLIKAGQEQLKTFDNHDQRAEKLLSTLVNIICNENKQYHI